MVSLISTNNVMMEKKMDQAIHVTQIALFNVVMVLSKQENNVMMEH